MDTSKALLAVAALIAVAATGGASPVQAASDGMIERGGPRWLDETVYRPDCPRTDRGRDWHADRICSAATVPCR
jgi:hypothetical protein